MLELNPPKLETLPRDDEFRARFGRTRGERGGTSGELGARLTKAMKGARAACIADVRGGARGSRGFAGDQRQRVVAKVSFHKHGFGGAAGGAAAS